MLDYLTVFQKYQSVFSCGCEGMKDEYLKSQGLQEDKYPDSPPVLFRDEASFQDTLEYST